MIKPIVALHSIYARKITKLRQIHEIFRKCWILLMLNHLILVNSTDRPIYEKQGTIDLSPDGNASIRERS